MRSTRAMIAANATIRLQTSIVPFEAGDGSWIVLRPGNPLTLAGNPVLRVLFDYLSSARPIGEVIQSVASRSGAPACIVEAYIDQFVKRRLIFEERSGDDSSNCSGRYLRQIDQFAQHETDDRSRFDMQRSLSGAHVVQVGVGGLGSWIATNLTMAGIGELTLVDGDTVEVTNLHRQNLYRASDIGEKKARAAASALAAMNPEVRISPVDSFVSDANLALRLIPVEADLVILSADEPLIKLRTWVADACQKLRVPLIMVASGGVGPLIEPGGEAACWHCQELLLQDQFPPISAWMQEIDKVSRNGLPQPVMPGYHSMMAGLVMMDVVKFLTGMQAPRTRGALLLWSQASSTVAPQTLARHPQCQNHQHAYAR